MFPPGGVWSFRRGTVPQELVPGTRGYTPWFPEKLQRFTYRPLVGTPVGDGNSPVVPYQGRCSQKGNVLPGDVPPLRPPGVAAEAGNGGTSPLLQPVSQESVRRKLQMSNERCHLMILQPRIRRKITAEQGYRLEKHLIVVAQNQRRFPRRHKPANILQNRCGLCAAVHQVPGEYQVIRRGPPGCPGADHPVEGDELLKAPMNVTNNYRENTCFHAAQYTPGGTPVILSLHEPFIAS